MFCGQLQCTVGEEKPYFVDYGTQYQQILLNDKLCRLVASLCVTAPDGFLLFCLVGIWFCFFKIKDVLFVSKTEEIPEKRDEIFSGKIFLWKEKKNCLYKEMANCLKKKRRNSLKTRGEIVRKQKREIAGKKKGDIVRKKRK